MNDTNSAWQVLKSVTHGYGVALHRLIGREKKKPDSTESGSVKSPLSLNDDAMLPRIAPEVERALKTVTVGEIMMMPPDVTSRAISSFLRIVNNPYSETAIADACYLLLAVQVHRMDFDEVDI